jgi:hypothetical protein
MAENEINEALKNQAARIWVKVQNPMLPDNVDDPNNSGHSHSRQVIWGSGDLKQRIANRIQVEAKQKRPGRFRLERGARERSTKQRNELLDHHL